MKISFAGIPLSEGKVKFQDQRLIELEKKLSPKKTNPFFVEFIQEHFDLADIIVCLKDKILDLFIPDLDKLEKQLQASQDEAQKQLFARCASSLEKEVPLCDVGFSKEELQALKEYQFLTLKPTLIEDTDPQDVNQLIRKSLDKAHTIFFYTVAKGELKSWAIKQGTTVIEAAGKIHSDLARGFIKAEVVNFGDFIQCHNMQDAKTKGKALLVDRDYVVQDGDIIEIKFNV